MDYMCRLGSLGNSSTSSVVATPGGVRPVLQLGRRDFFVCSLYFSSCIFICLISFLLFPCEVFWRTLCVSSTILIAILNGTVLLFARGKNYRSYFGRSFAYQKQYYYNNNSFLVICYSLYQSSFVTLFKWKKNLFIADDCNAMGIDPKFSMFEFFLRF